MEKNATFNALERQSVGEAFGLDCLTRGLSGRRIETARESLRGLV